MNDIIYFSILTVGIIICMYLVSPFSSKKSIKSSNKKIEEHKKDTEIIKILLNDPDAYDKYNKLLDTLIRDAINMYKIMTVTTEETYFTKNNIKELETYVLLTLQNKMSKDIVDLIKIFNVIEKEEDLKKVLEQRVKLHLINNVINQNKPIGSEE